MLTKFEVTYSLPQTEPMTAFFATNKEAFMFHQHMKLLGFPATSPLESIVQEDVILLADSYKYSHWKQYPEKTTFIYDYMESRGGTYKVTCFVGLQYYLLKYLSARVTVERVEYANAEITAHMGPDVFDYEGWMRIATVHEGRLPLEIRAVKEGTVVPVKNALMTMMGTDDLLPWVPSFVETLLMKVWAPITVSTTSLTGKTVIRKYLEETADDISGLLFKLHDFGDRGVSSPESAGILGLAHLVHFRGTDTTRALQFAKYFYKCAMAGFSIPATEHSSMTILGRDGEYIQMKRFITQFGSAKLKACVSDSFDIDKAMDFWATLKDLLIEQGATLVVRPDSGDPIEMSLRCVNKLGLLFGYTLNGKGYKLLHPTVRVIYGDGLDTPLVIRDILENYKQHKWSADNIAFGMGGGLLQKCNRDTQKFAVKASAAIVDGELLMVRKDPITDPGKVSKEGILDLVIDENGKYKTVMRPDTKSYADSALTTVFRNGKVLVEYTLDEIRETADKSAEVYKEELLAYFNQAV
jgi:nicotinamide phosphoribosyltransferase